MGSAIAVPSFSLWLLAKLQLGTSFRFKARTLVTHGLYSKIRHPIYLFSSLALVDIPKLQVYRVSIIGKNRKRNTLMGVGIGVAAGIGVGVAANRVVGENWVIPGVALAYAGVGAGIGALVPASKTIYREEVPKQASLKAPAR